MKLISLTVLLLSVCAICSGQRFKRQVQSCTGLSNTPGSCKLLRDCSQLQVLLRNNRGNALLIREIQRTSAECNVSRSQVCCPGARADANGEMVSQTDPPSRDNIVPSAGITLPTFEEGCGVLGKHVSFQKVIGGRPPALGTWPWIALLGYVTPSGQSFKCGGTIITRRHVLTAAHCVSQFLSFVRLGEHDINNLTETQHVDIPIRRAVKHPNFQIDQHAGRSDIAVLYLERDIPFTNLIKPICLPQTESLRNQKFQGYSPFIAGWGTTNPDTEEGSSLLQQVQIKVQDNLYCDAVYKMAKRIKPDEDIDDAFICAGDLSGEKDSCYGDSGGPLLIAVNPKGTQHYFLLIGVVSSGLRCAFRGAPSLYTRTSFFIDWISDRVAEPI